MDRLSAMSLTNRQHYSATREPPSDDQAKISPPDPGHRDWTCGVRLWRFGGNSDDYTITVTVSGPSASERALGIATAIAPLLPGAVAPTLRQITPAVERTATGGVSVTVTAAPVGPVYEFQGSTPLDEVWSRLDCGAAKRD